MFLPDFDPGALETLLALAVNHNNRDLWAILPKQAGSVVPISLATYADEQGTVDGKPSHGASLGGDDQRRAYGSFL